MADTAISKNNIVIRLPEERWTHIVQEHGELAFFQREILDTISDPDFIVAGQADEHIAIKQVELGKWLAVIYSEDIQDGFVITAFLTRQRKWWARRRKTWP